jgi:ORF6N domain
MKENQIVKVENVEDKIYMIRGQRVMFDSDLAEVYQVETRVLNQAVKRNLHRFPEDFMFQLNAEEVETLRNSSQFVMSSTKHRGATYRPYVFTEHGAVMLASVLNSPTAIEASIKVVRAFVQMRSILALHKDLADRMAELEKNTDIHSQNFVVIDELLGEIFRNPKFLKRKIGFVEEEKKKK